MALNRVAVLKMYGPAAALDQVTGADPYAPTYSTRQATRPPAQRLYLEAARAATSLPDTATF